MNKQKTMTGLRLITLGLLVPFANEMALGAESESTKASIAARLKEERAKLGTPLKNPTLVDRLRVKAARAGDEVERKEIIKQMNSDKPEAQHEAIVMAGEVGGADMIRELGKLLSVTKGGGIWGLAGVPRDKWPKDRQCFEIFDPPNIVAAMMLSKVVENPPAELKGKHWKRYYENEVKIWKKWWEENKAKYEVK